MEKAIYIITNKVNGKQYIGQTIHPDKRWWEHCRRAITKYDSYPIHLAIAKYGKKNFDFEVLEWTENYDQREDELIIKFNTIVPNGYNLITGGHSPIMFGEEHPRNKVPDNVLKDVLRELNANMLNDRQIAKKYNLTDKIVSDINHGKTHRFDGIDYPIRSFNQRPNRLSEEIADQIKDLLRTTNLSYQEIADMFNTRKSIVYQINTGRNFKRNKDNYPIRRINKCWLKD